MGCYAVQSGISFVTCKSNNWSATSVRFNAHVQCDTPEDTDVMKFEELN